MTDYVKIAGKKIPTILAITTDEQESGLMYKKWPPPVMSFVYASPRINKFWMKNCISPLDIVFSNKGKIISIFAGEPNSTRVIGDDRLSDLVVEFPAGTCKAYDIKVGHEIELEYSDEAKMKIFALKSGIKY
jgi:uncharacterized membrane protein (UPF0127 family)